MTTTEPILDQSREYTSLVVGGPIDRVVVLCAEQHYHHREHDGTFTSYFRSHVLAQDGSRRYVYLPFGSKTTAGEIEAAVNDVYFRPGPTAEEIAAADASDVWDSE